MELVGVSSALANLATSIALALAGVVSFSMAVVPARTPRALPPLLAFVAGAALVFLAADEGLELHDRVGRWLYHEHGIAAPGPVNHVDDMIVFGYIAVGAVVAAASLPVLAASPRFLASMLAAGALMAVGAAFDAFGATGTWTEMPEEGLEAAGALLLAAVLGVEALRGRTLRLSYGSVAPSASAR